MNRVLWDYLAEKKGIMIHMLDLSEKDSCVRVSCNLVINGLCASWR